MNSEKDIKKAIQNYLQSLSMHSINSQLRWHRAIHNMGRPAIPKLKEHVIATSRLGIEHKTKYLIIAGLVTILHDIDEKSAEEVVARILQEGCDSLIRERVKTIVSKHNNFRRYEINDIRIFEHQELNQPYKIKVKLKQWMDNVPSEHLLNIDRIYIVPHTNQKYRGSYKPIFDVISLVWKDEKIWLPFFS